MSAERKYWVKAFLLLFTTVGIPLVGQCNETRGLRGDVATLAKRFDGMQAGLENLAREQLEVHRALAELRGRTEALENERARRAKK